LGDKREVTDREWDEKQGEEDGRKRENDMRARAVGSARKPPVVSNAARARFEV
jgi:hypothetical protein